MTTPRMPAAPALTARLAKAQAFAASPFCLVDVGASGGIEEHWRVFEPHLIGFGFDPLVKEVERLNSAERTRTVRYFEGYVGCDGFEQLVSPEAATDWRTRTYERSSAVRAQKLLGMSITARFNNDDPDIVLSRRRFALDAFFRDQPLESLDFLKVDTDGQDYEVLLGARGLLSTKGALGAFVECQLQGPAHAHSNTFASIDRLMRELGFAAFDIEVYRYTRAALPGPFMYALPAQTLGGQVSFAEVLYLRDLAAPSYEARWGFAATPQKLLKLACLFEVFGLPDCAAELLLARRAGLADLLDVDAALDTLARQVDPDAAGFAELNARFERDPRAFYPVPDPDAPARVELRAIKGSLSWKITAPLRRIRRLLSA